MAIGQRIKFIRNLRGLTQKELGLAIGFTDRTSDVRIAQYEAEKRVPKERMIEDIARVLDVEPFSLDVPNIDTYIGLLHTLFAIEDMYGLKIGEIDGKLCLKVDINSDSHFADRLNDWRYQAKKLSNGEISLAEYNDWRLNYPASNVFNKK